MLAVAATVAILLVVFVLNSRAAYSSPVYRGYKNSVIVSALVFAAWLLLDQFVIPGSWWSLSGGAVLLSILATLGLMALNIGLYRWYMGGRDYAGLVKAGVVSDGCPYVGSFAIPKNFITHGGMTLWEEILFRGLIGVSLYLWLGPVVAILVTSVLFGLVHYLPFRAYAKHNGIKSDRYVLGAFISPALFPAVFMAANLISGSLIPGWIMHWGLNCSVGLYLQYMFPAFQRGKAREEEYAR